MNELALCAGIGGSCLGLKRAGFRTVCYVEIEKYPVEVIKARIRDRQLDDAPIWDDVTTFNGTPWRGRVDIITAGFPCQPFSQAGRRRGEQDERYIWQDIQRIICEVRPRYVLLENVPGLSSLERGRTMGRILGDLASWLSDCGGGGIESVRLRASDFGAPHQRERIFIVAYPGSQRRQQITTSAHEGRTPQHHHQSTSDGQGNGSTIVENTNELGESWAPLNIANGQRSPSESTSLRRREDRAQMAHASSAGWTKQHVTPFTGEQGYLAWRKIAPGRTLVESSTSGRERLYHSAGRAQGTQSPTQQSSQRESERGICRVFDGLPSRMDRSLWPAGPGQEQYDWEPARTITERQPQRVARLKSLGNGIVPQITEYIGYCIINHYQQIQQREWCSASLDYTNNHQSSWTEAHGSEAM